MARFPSWAILGSFAQFSQAAIQSYCASGASNVCYSISIPEATVSSGSGDIFLQITAPDSYEWIGLGYGSRMAGAYMFIMYADGTGNVTISPRTASGHVEPEYNSAATLTLLEGSGVTNGVMTGNFKCSGSGCGTTIDATSASSNWISAWKSGSALNSADLSEGITQHDGHASFTYDLTSAVESNDVNPFVASTSFISSPDTGTSGSTGTTSSDGTTEVSSSSTSSSATRLLIAHGVIMGMTVAVLLPLGAILVRITNMWIHLSIQILSLALLWAGFGIGIKVANQQNQLFNNAHTKFGTILVCLFVLQPIGGYFHHRHYVTAHSKSVFTDVHVWIGRVLILLAIINGGLGLQLADNTTGGTIAYSVVAGVMCLVWFITVPLMNWRKRRADKRGAIDNGEKKRLGSQ